MTSPGKPLRVVTFNFLPVGYKLLTEWIHTEGHKHILAVTTPGPKSRPTPSYKDVVAMAGRDVEVLVTTRLRSVVTPLLRALKPDLITCLSFPYRITPELCALPTYGAVNIHPALLPAYRGPNVMRQFYEGAAQFGATAHWIAEDYDTGNVLSQKAAAMPDVVDGRIFSKWTDLISETISEGMARAVNGEPGEVQDDTLATYAAPFTEAETWLDLNEPAHTLLRKATALNMAKAGTAKVKVAGELYCVFDIKLRPTEDKSAEPDARKNKQKWLTVETADAPIKLNVEAMT